MTRQEMEALFPLTADEDKKAVTLVEIKKELDRLYTAEEAASTAATDAAEKIKTLQTENTKLMLNIVSGNNRHADDENHEKTFEEIEEELVDMSTAERAKYFAEKWVAEYEAETKKGEQ